MAGLLPNRSSGIAVRQPGHAAPGSDRYGSHDALADGAPPVVAPLFF